MKKHYQLLGLAEPTQGLLGIEIEAEGQNMLPVNNKYWKSEDDGSLRGHYPESRSEFVLKHPIMLEDVDKAIDNLICTQEAAEFDFSYRTSVHIHVNVQELTHDQIINVVYTSLLLEEPLLHYCGKTRKANRFCLRLADAEGLMDVVKNMCKDREDSYYLANDNIRYSAVNLAALMKYGSIEYRGMRGNMDKVVIQTWASALVAIREYAMAHKTPVTIKEEVEALGPNGFLKRVLGDALYKVFAYPRLQKDMAKSYSISLDVPYCFKEYVEIPKGEGVIPTFTTQAEINAGNMIEGLEMYYGGSHYKVVNGNYTMIGKAPIDPPKPKVLRPRAPVAPVAFDVEIGN